MNNRHAERGGMPVNELSVQRGVGLIEVLIALLVLSVGFLYTANMQVRAMRTNQDAYYHSQALMLAGDMMDRMRGNPDGVAGNAYDDESTFESGTAPACLATSCSATELATVDLYEWSAALSNLRGATGFVPLLPPAVDGSAAVGSITVNAAGDHVITMVWKESPGGTEVDRTVSLNFSP